MLIVKICYQMYCFINNSVIQLFGFCVGKGSKQNIQYCITAIEKTAKNPPRPGNSTNPLSNMYNTCVRHNDLGKCSERAISIA